MRIETGKPKGTGRTYNLLKNAKPNALFICLDKHSIKYVHDILCDMNRDDLYVLSYDDIFPFNGFHQAGMTFSEIILDHVIILDTCREYETMRYLCSLSRTPTSE